MLLFSNINLFNPAFPPPAYSNNWNNPSWDPVEPSGGGGGGTPDPDPGYTYGDVRFNQYEEEEEDDYDDGWR